MYELRVKSGTCWICSLNLNKSGNSNVSATLTDYSQAASRMQAIPFRMKFEKCWMKAIVKNKYKKFRMKLRYLKCFFIQSHFSIRFRPIQNYIVCTFFLLGVVFVVIIHSIIFVNHYSIDWIWKKNWNARGAVTNQEHENNLIKVFITGICRLCMCEYHRFNTNFQFNLDQQQQNPTHQQPFCIHKHP